MTTTEDLEVTFCMVYRGETFPEVLLPETENVLFIVMDSLTATFI